MRVYLTDLASYNNGNLVGKWVSLPMSEEELSSKIQEILELGSAIDGYGEAHEEYFITDYECEFMEVGEYDNLDKLNEIAEAMEEIDEDGVKAINFLVENHLVKDIFEAIESYEDSVRIYEDSSMEHIAYDYVNECYNLDELAPLIANNLDYEEIVEFSKQFSGLVAKKVIHFKTMIADNLKATFYGDWVRINQICFNLISNAVKFTPSDGEITFSAKYQDDSFVVSVKDNGIGMNKEVQSKIFKPFEQADGTTTRKYGGTGLGLSITQNLVELMNGTIELESQEGFGTTFTVSLPLPRIQKEKNEEVSTIAEVVEDKDDTLKGHILIVEDNKTNQMLVKMLLFSWMKICQI